MGEGADLQSELELEPMGEDSVEVVLGSNAGEEMVRMRVGRSFDDGPGNYIQRLGDADEPIYLTSQGVFISKGVDSYLDKQIVDHDRSEVRRVVGRDFQLERASDGDELELTEVPRGSKVKSSEVGRLASALSGLRYDEVFVGDDPQVSALQYEPALEISLEDGTGYILSLAESDDKVYLKIRGHSEIQQVAITVDESEEELQEKAEMLTRADEIDAFNSFHGSWVYEIGEFVAEKLQLTRDDLLESDEG